MTKKYQVAFLWAVLFCAAGCSTISMQSVKDAGAVHKLNRLYIFVKCGEVKNLPMMNNLAAGLVNCFSNQPAKVQVTVTSPLDLDPNVYDRQIKEFAPDSVLILSMTASVVDPYGGYPNMTFDAGLFNPATKKLEWRASIVNSGSTDVMDRRMRKMSDSIVNQLKLDGFL